MRIAIATSGRFHVLDLARELAALGHDVAFYSYVPKDRAVAFGLPAQCHRSLILAAAPFLTCERLFGDWGRDLRQLGLKRALNRAVVKALEPCDVFICMSGVYVEAAKYALERFGARIYLERGSVHVDVQNEILWAAGGRQIASHTVKREQAGYALADRIVIPASHVAATFSASPELAAKVFINPYGVDLDMFPQRNGPPPHPRRVLFVGNWSYQKGVDVLTEAIRQLGDCELVHVGAVRDAPLPDDPWFAHHDPVEQSELSRFYHSASLFCIASRQEGLAMVQAQALASGLPLVCTNMTGGRDLAHALALAERIRVVPTANAPQLSNTIAQALDDVAASRIPPLTVADRRLLSWRGYGKRYAEELMTGLSDAAPAGSSLTQAAPLSH